MTLVKKRFNAFSRKFKKIYLFKVRSKIYFQIFSFFTVRKIYYLGRGQLFRVHAFIRLFKSLQDVSRKLFLRFLQISMFSIFTLHQSSDTSRLIIFIDQDIFSCLKSLQNVFLRTLL